MILDRRYLILACPVGFTGIAFQHRTPLTGLKDSFSFSSSSGVNVIFLPAAVHLWLFVLPALLCFHLSPSISAEPNSKVGKGNT